MPEEFIRPWGNYTVIEKIKIITVKPYSELSLQYHSQRDEFWRIISGNCKVILGKKEFYAKPGDTFNIPKNLEHRLITENSKVEFLEIATGSVDEDDVVRLEDKYGRTQNRTKCQN